MTERSLVSVVICTRNGGERVRGTLDSVLSDSSTVPFELIVVDNGSTDGTADIVSALGPIRLIQEPEPGQSRARNAGVRYATGDVVLFTDDDVVVHDGWRDAMVTPFQNAAVRVVGGRVAPRWSAPPPEWLDHRTAQYLALPDFGEVSRELREDESPVGACIAFRRADLRRHQFRVDLGHRPGLRFGNEEIDVVRRVRSTGSVVYSASARCEHLIDADRLTISSIRQARFHAGISTSRMLAAPGSRRADLREAAGWMVRLVRARLDRSRGLSADTVAAECETAMWLGACTSQLFRNHPSFVDAIARRFPG